MRVAAVSGPVPADAPELRLDLSEAAAAELSADPIYFAEAAEEAEQTMRFFDTPAHDLRRAGFSVQMFDANGRQSVHLAAETHRARCGLGGSAWQYAFDGEQPVLDTRSIEALKVLTGLAITELVPTFTLRCTTLRSLFEAPPANVAMILRRGDCTIGGSGRPVSELVLRLNRGDVRDLFALADELAERYAVTRGVVGDFEHGVALLGIAGEIAPPMSTIGFGPDLTAEQCFVAMMEAAQRHFRVSSAAARLGRSGDIMIEAEIAVRYLRLTLTMFEEMVGGGELDHFRRELQWLAAAFAQIRVPDLVMERMAQADRPGGMPGRWCALLDAGRTRALFLGLAAWGLAGDWRTSNAGAVLRLRRFAEFGPDGLERMRNQVKDWTRNRMAMTNAERQQALSASKRLRDVADRLAKPQSARRTEPFSGALDRFQSALGELSETMTVNAAMGELVMLDGLVPKGAWRRTPRARRTDPVEDQPFD